jgi:hypothetical protein
MLWWFSDPRLIDHCSMIHNMTVGTDTAPVRTDKIVALG